MPLSMMHGKAGFSSADGFQKFCQRLHVISASPVTLTSTPPRGNSRSIQQTSPLSLHAYDRPATTPFNIHQAKTRGHSIAVHIADIVDTRSDERKI
jgi:hypothetical protein